MAAKGLIVNGLFVLPHKISPIDVMNDDGMHLHSASSWQYIVSGRSVHDHSVNSSFGSGKGCVLSE